MQTILRATWNWRQAPPMWLCALRISLASLFSPMSASSPLRPSNSAPTASPTAGGKYFAINHKGMVCQSWAAFEFSETCDLPFELGEGGLFEGDLGEASGDVIARCLDGVPASDHVYRLRRAEGGEEGEGGGDIFVPLKLSLKHHERFKIIFAKKERNRFGRFFYRFPNGEAGLDVYNRITSFISTLFRDSQQLRGQGVNPERVNRCPMATSKELCA
jgi:hypothetical protein